MSEPDCWMFLSWLAHNFSRVCVASIASIYGHGPSIQQCCEPVWCRCSLASRHGARPSQDRVVFYGRAREWCLGTDTWRGCRARAPASRPLNPSHLCWLQRAVHRSYGDLTVGDLYQSGTQLTARITGVRKKNICHQSPNLSFLLLASFCHDPPLDHIFQNINLICPTLIFVWNWIEINDDVQDHICSFSTRLDNELRLMRGFIYTVNHWAI